MSSDAAFAAGAAELLVIARTFGFRPDAMHVPDGFVEQLGQGALEVNERARYAAARARAAGEGITTPPPPAVFRRTERP